MKIVVDSMPVWTNECLFCSNIYTDKMTLLTVISHLKELGHMILVRKKINLNQSANLTKMELLLMQIKSTN